MDARFLGDTVYFCITSLAIFEPVAPAVELDDEDRRGRIFLADDIVDGFLVDMTERVHEVSLVRVAAKDARELHLRKYVVAVANDAEQDAVEVMLDRAHNERAAAVMEYDLLRGIIGIELFSAMNRTSHLASDYSMPSWVRDILRSICLDIDSGLAGFDGKETDEDFGQNGTRQHRSGYGGCICAAALDYVGTKLF